MNQQLSADLMVSREWFNKLAEDGPVPHIEKLVHCPLGAGYFFRFCKSQFCSETIHFIIEVDKYIEIFCTDDGGWDENKSWKDTDRDLGISGAACMTEINIKRDIIDRINTDEFIPVETWPSGKVDRTAVLESIRTIWSRYFDETAPEQICLPPAVIANTCKRLLNAHLYGKDVFQEACRDRTIVSTQKDIAMRFRQSEELQIYMQHLQELQRPLCTVSIHIPAPRYTLTCVYTKNQLLEEDALLFTLDEILADSFLYAEFMKYLNRSFASENLRFIRAVYLFKKSIGAKDGDRIRKASDWAFKVFQNFIIAGSAYEICVTKAVQREIARNIATPHLLMFQVAEKSTMATLKLLFESYRKTPEYLSLRVKIAENFELLNQAHAAPGHGHSLSFNTMNSKMVMARAMLQRQGSGNCSLSSNHKDGKDHKPLFCHSSSTGTAGHLVNGHGVAQHQHSQQELHLSATAIVPSTSSSNLAGLNNSTAACTIAANTVANASTNTREGRTASGRFLPPINTSLAPAPRSSDQAVTPEAITPTSYGPVISNYYPDTVGVSCATGETGDATVVPDITPRTGAPQRARSYLGGTLAHTEAGETSTVLYQQQECAEPDVHTDQYEKSSAEGGSAKQKVRKTSAGMMSLPILSWFGSNK